MNTLLTDLPRIVVEHPPWCAGDYPTSVAQGGVREVVHDFVTYERQVGESRGGRGYLTQFDEFAANGELVSSAMSFKRLRRHRASHRPPGGPPGRRPDPRRVGWVLEKAPPATSSRAG